MTAEPPAVPAPDERVERRRNLQLLDAVTNAAPVILWAMDADGT